MFLFFKFWNIWSYCVWIVTDPKNVLVTPLPVQKLRCLLIQSFNHPENKGNWKLISIPITYNLYWLFSSTQSLSIQWPKFTFQFSIFHFANGDLSMTSLRMTSNSMKSRCGVHCLLGLCEYYCFINMLNFNKLRFIVYEIFDNSQLFLTDPRIYAIWWHGILTKLGDSYRQ